MKKLDFESKQNDLQQIIYQHAKEEKISTATLEPIADGVADIVGYLLSKIKIALLMKEPYDSFDEEGNPIGGGWEIYDVFSKEESCKVKAYKVLFYILYSLINNVVYDVAPYPNKETLNEYLGRTAYLNTSKMPGQKTSKAKTIKEAYNSWSKLLLEQLSTYQPDVVLFGGTFKYFKNDLGINDNDIIKIEDSHIEYAVKKGVLYIGAYHPSQRRMKEDQYVDSIVSLIKRFEELKDLDKNNPSLLL